MSPSWILYGANGYTGRLIVQEAARRGLRPILAGRSSEIASLANAHELEHRIFALDDIPTAARAIAGARLVLHCAGPFSATSRPMLEACLQARAAYLDITGEIDVL